MADRRDTYSKGVLIRGVGERGTLIRGFTVVVLFGLYADVSFFLYFPFSVDKGNSCRRCLHCTCRLFFSFKVSDDHLNGSVQFDLFKNIVEVLIQTEVPG